MKAGYFINGACALLYVLLDFTGKTIHSLNKNEHALDMAAPLHDRLGDNIDAPTYENASVKTRRNVLLLGDHIGDLGMSDGLNYENRISAGFLNDNVENSLDSYRKTFDIVYLNDAPMWGVVKLVSQLCPSEGH
ncbi:PREDICTED: 7-methylguanosine phosphate-specific [Prunus dulcis]|uniref:5'-nucleotidase n=2 Tax=Prunus dulcis TaxID=3755 RepID=A0A5E4GKS1_PRUDU|nr:PREDICTED: 7-methylguanosine phosphate-specific [Prunus dulcis]